MFGDKINFTDFIFNIALAIFGGFVKLLTENSKHKTLRKYVASAIVGGFAGILTYLICQYFNWNIYLTAFATGVAGYTGDSILNFFSSIIPLIFKKKINIEIENKEGGKK